MQQQPPIFVLAETDSHARRWADACRLRRTQWVPLTRSDMLRGVAVAIVMDVRGAHRRRDYDELITTARARGLAIVDVQ